MKKLLVLILILTILITTIYSNQNNNTKYKYKVTNLKDYIYQTYKLNEEEYKFITTKQNYIGELMYVYKVYRARGTLIINLNLLNNTISSRIVPEIKEPNTVSFNNRREIILNTLAGGNRFYYISPSVKLYSFESPSYNLSEPIPSNSYFYWLGYRLLQDKKIQKKMSLFRYKYNNIQFFDLQNLMNKIKMEGYKIVDFKPYDNFIVFNTYKNNKFKIYIYDFYTQKTIHVHESNFILLDRAPNKKVYIIQELSNNSYTILEYDEIMKGFNKIYDISNPGLPRNLIVLPYSQSKFYLALSFTTDQKNKYTNFFVKDNSIIYSEEFNGILNAYVYKGKDGIFYTYEDSVVEVLK